jgi:hypothetical protein
MNKFLIAIVLTLCTTSAASAESYNFPRYEIVKGRGSAYQSDNPLRAIGRSYLTECRMIRRQNRRQGHRYNFGSRGNGFNLFGNATFRPQPLFGF